MGLCFNPGMNRFSMILRREKYVDKSELISFLNRRIEEGELLLCVTRPRRFGKNFAARMLTACYDRSCNASALFAHLKIAGDPSFRTHLNRYHVLSYRHRFHVPGRARIPGP